jgi:hypothetical protein
MLDFCRDTLPLIRTARPAIRLKIVGAHPSRRIRALAAIPGVDAFEVVTEVSAKNAYRHGVSMEFADRATYEAYNAHPDHVAFVTELWESEVAEFLEIDFVAAAGHQATGSA